jgi:hypothetical protein
MHTLNFEDLYEYDDGVSGITLPVKLSFGGQDVKALAKLDTGSTYCIFQRERGEELGLNIESGEQEEISTRMGSFTAYGHEAPLLRLAFSWISWLTSRRISDSHAMCWADLDGCSGCESVSLITKVNSTLADTM